MSHDSHVTRGQMEDISEIIQVIISPGRHDQRRHGKLPRGQPAVLDADPGGQGALVLGGQRHRQDRADHDHGDGDQGEDSTVQYSTVQYSTVQYSTVRSGRP